MPKLSTMEPEPVTAKCVAIGQVVHYYERGDTTRSPVAAIVTDVHRDDPNMVRLSLFSPGVAAVLPVPGWVRHLHDPWYETRYQALLQQGGFVHPGEIDR